MKDPKDQAALALKTYLLSLAVVDEETQDDWTSNIFTGKEGAEKPVPNIICSVESGVEEPLDTGNYILDAEIQIHHLGVYDSDGIDPRDENNALVDSVIAAIRADDIADQLTDALENFHCFGLYEFSTSFEDQGDCFVDTIRFKIYCAAADL